MKISCLKEFDLGTKLGQVRSVPVSLGDALQDAVLFVYSEQENLDPWHELFRFPSDTLKMALYSMDGILMWKRDLGRGVIPGVWFTPFISFDLNQDGIDEIWFVNNLNEDLPFSLNSRVLECIDPLTGETTGRWPWPANTIDDTMSHSYRFFITGGYVHETPVLLTAQGTYGDMYLQTYNKGMEKRWEIKIPRNDHGARSSHLCPVLDFNDDGIDELFWGERLISFDDGHELFCGDKGRYLGHSDMVVPFVDEKNGKKYIFTCREDYEVKGEPRVITYDEQGKRAWTAVESHGHMHNGWIACIGPDYQKISMAMRINRVVINHEIQDIEPEDFYFDAITGKPVESPLPFKGSEFMPVDFNGDGYHEFYGVCGTLKGYITDRFGTIYHFIGGEQIRSGKVFSFPGEQMMLFYPEEGKVRIWGDQAAVESEYFQKRFSRVYHTRMQHFMGTGYNHINSHVTCGM